jgi:hypothetical protein
MFFSEPARAPCESACYRDLVPRIRARSRLQASSACAGSSWRPGSRGPRWQPRDFELDIACGKGIDEALETTVGMGPASRALEGQPPELRAAVTESVRKVLQPYQRAQNDPLPQRFGWR